MTDRNLISAHGGKLINLMVDETRATEIQRDSKEWLSWDLTGCQQADLELLICGGFSPLTGFMNKKDFTSVCDNSTLADGTFWPLPIILDVSEEMAGKLAPGAKLSLRDPEGVMLAVVTVDEVWQIDKVKDRDVAKFLDGTGSFYVSGQVEGLRLPIHYDFPALRRTPDEIRAEFARLGWRQVVAYQSERVIHRAEQEFSHRAALSAKANLLIHPLSSGNRTGEVDYYTEIKSYRAVLPYYPQQTAQLSLLPYAARQAGPREALLRALIARNYGCTHLIVDPGENKLADYTKAWKNHGEAVGVDMIPFEQMVYVEESAEYLPSSETSGKTTKALSEAELAGRLDDGRAIPEWFTFPEVATELCRGHKPRQKQGFTVFFTGLSGSGKSTVANVLQVKLMQQGDRPVTLLDGDIVRKNLSSELGFSKEHRDLNIARIGYVASEITKNGGIAICAPIAPYEKVRGEVRQLISSVGGFALTWVSTPLETCEQRDRKGLYAKARAGIIKEFTGISDPYEEPTDAEVVIDTTDLSPEQAVWEIMKHLEAHGYIGSGQRD